MKTMRLVRYRKEGKKTYYMLDDNHIEQLMATGNEARLGRVRRPPRRLMNYDTVI